MTKYKQTLADYLQDVERRRSKYPDCIYTHADECWVLVMCDYHAEGIWDQEGCESSAVHLPISSELAARVLLWQDLYNQLDFIDGLFDPAMYERYLKVGFEIAIEIKCQLPDWMIIYHDEERINELYRRFFSYPRKGIDRNWAYFEYEITDEVVRTGKKPEIKII